ncbi:MAG: cation transporting ATPase C-terminal domain-containing protein, partial [Bacillota bacterium]
SELLRAYTCRSEILPLWKIGFFSNRNMNLAFLLSLALLVVVLVIPGLRGLFNVATLHLHDVDFVVLMGMLPLVFGEITKIVKAYVKRKRGNQGRANLN